MVYFSICQLTLVVLEKRLLNEYIDIVMVLTVLGYWLRTDGSTVLSSVILGLPILQWYALCATCSQPTSSMSPIRMRLAYRPMPLSSVHCAMMAQWLLYETCVGKFSCLILPHNYWVSTHLENFGNFVNLENSWNLMSDLEFLVW